MYEKVNTNLNFAEKELDVLKFWDDNNIFEKSIEQKENCPTFTFFDGPPTANGKPHIGHVLTRVVKDVIPRYQTMKGKKVLRKAGWDTHGLPVELEVEKSLGLSGKPQIESYGLEPFINRCKESVWTYKTAWEDMSKRVGYWVDMDRPYITYDNDYIESEWWALKTIWDKELLYKGHKIVPYCPRCGTALSSHEVAQGYKSVTEESVIAKFKVKGTENEFFLAWTTTPWTLPSNVALTVNADFDYLKIKCENEIYYIAESLVDSVIEQKYEVLQKLKGIEMEYMEYEPLYDFSIPDKKAYYVTCAPYVTANDGTGIVHTAPAFGEDDSNTGHNYDLPFLQLVDEAGCFSPCVTPWAGRFVKDCDADIIKDLGSSGKLFKALPFEHDYPFCWRCDTPLLYYARDTWFIKMSSLRNNLVTNNNTVNWIPDNIKQGRFGNFLENVIDWGLSRERYWGTPLPIWECECGHHEVVGSIAELKEKGNNIPDNIELHRPFIDNITITCHNCGKEMQRVKEVIDCWFDSGSMPFAQWHYPFENRDLFEKQFPANFISEAVDQTRGWFYTLMAISTLLFDKAPYENVIVLGHVQDKDGRKMSKHLHNVTDPWEPLNSHGADAIRWYFIINSAPWLPNRFYDDAVSEAQHKFMGTLWNTYAFYILYAEIDSFNPAKYVLEKENLPVMDKWILSKLNALINEVDEDMAGYKLTESARAINDFVDELSNWYVRRCRERYWGKDMPQDKINAYMTLYTVLENVIKLSAPFVPFITEEIYQNLVRTNFDKAPVSIHLCDFPKADKTYIDENLNLDMESVLETVILGRAARNAANIKNRQPIGTMYIKATFKDLSTEFTEIISEELNVKKIIYTDDITGFTTYNFKPQLKTMGPKFGKLVPQIGKALAGVDGNELMKQLRNGSATLEVEGNKVEFTSEDVLTEEVQKEGFVFQGNRDISVVLDTNLTEELLQEGYLRELVSKIQNMRKEANYEVLDKINVFLEDNGKVSDTLKKSKESLASDVLAKQISCLSSDEISKCKDAFIKRWNINGDDITIAISRI